MKAIIDIKTPAGQSLEGFPRNLEATRRLCAFTVLEEAFLQELEKPEANDLHIGDRITIEIV